MGIENLHILTEEDPPPVRRTAFDLQKYLTTEHQHGAHEGKPHQKCSLCQSGK